MITLTDLKKFKTHREAFTCLTAYDACFARMASEIGIETLLVGDSLGNVIQGHSSTVPVTMDDMCYHTSLVARGNTHSMIFADMPFMSYSTPDQTLENAARLMQAGGHIVKMEGGEWLCESISLLTERGIPVCSHLGLTPQSVHTLGGYKVQGRDDASAEKLIREAKAVEQAGAAVLVLECVPAALANDITQMLTIPTIGIGAGNGTDAQVMVLYDILGLKSGYAPKFVKNFLTDERNADKTIQGALKAYHESVKDRSFPAIEHSF